MPSLRDRRSRVNAAARAARSAAENAKKVRELQRQLKENAAGSDAAKQLAAERAAWKRERALLERGFSDEDGRATAEALWSRLPAKDRPEIGDWLDGFKEDTSKAPRALQPYLAPPTTETPAAAPPRRGAPPARPGETTPSAGAAVTPEALRAAGERARREGTPEAIQAYKALRAKVMERQ